MDALSSSNSASLAEADWECDPDPAPAPTPPPAAGEYCTDGLVGTYPTGGRYCLMFAGSCRGGSITNSFYGSAGCMQYYSPTWSPDSVRQRCTEWGLTYSDQPCSMAGLSGICTSRNNISRTGGMPYRDQFFYSGIPADTLNNIQHACQISGDGGGIWGTTPAFTPPSSAPDDDACKLPEPKDTLAEFDASLGDTSALSDADVIVMVAKKFDDRIFGGFMNLKSPIGSCVDEAQRIRSELEKFFLRGPGRHRLKSNRWVFLTQQMDWPYEGAHTRAFAYDAGSGENALILDPWEYHLGAAGNALSGGLPYRKVSTLDDAKSPFVDHLWKVDPEQYRCGNKASQRVTDSNGRIEPKYRPDWLPF